MKNVNNFIKRLHGRFILKSYFSTLAFSPNKLFFQRARSPLAGHCPKLFLRILPPLPWQVFPTCFTSSFLYMSPPLLNKNLIFFFHRGCFILTPCSFSDILNVTTPRSSTLWTLRTGRFTHNELPSSETLSFVVLQTKASSLPCTFFLFFSPS